MSQDLDNSSPEDPQTSAHHPHDRFFKCLLEERAITHDLLERYLPSQVLQHLNLQFLERMPNEGFFEQKLQVDVVWQSRIQSTDEPICILLEHQSTFDAKLAIRLRQYMIMLSYTISEAPIPVIAIVFYHGRQAHIPSILDLGGNPNHPIPFPGVYGLAAQVPIVNYQRLTWLEIPTNRPASMLECCLKAHLDPQWDFLATAMQNLLLWGGLAPKTIQEIHRYLLYQIQVHKSPLEIFYRIQQLPYRTPTTGDENMATLAEWISQTTPEMLQEKWLKEGLQKGLQKGLEQGQQQERRHLTQRLLSQGMSLESIAEITGYSLEDIQQWLSKE